MFDVLGHLPYVDFFDPRLLEKYCCSSVQLRFYTIFLFPVPMEPRVWSGVSWSEGSPGQKLQDLHQKLVDLKIDMQKLNDEAGGQLLFVSTYLS